MRNRCDNYTKDTRIVIKRRTTGITRFQKTNHSLFTNYQKYLTIRHTLLEKKNKYLFCTITFAITTEKYEKQRLIDSTPNRITKRTFTQLLCQSTTYTIYTGRP